MDVTKLAVLFASTGEDPHNHQEGLRNIEQFCSAGTGAFENVEIISGEGLGDANVPEIKNHCLAKAAESGAGWCLVMDPQHRIALESAKLLNGAFERLQAIWGPYATIHPPETEFKIHIPQILSMDNPQDLLIFDPLLALQGPFYVRTEAALEVAFDPRQNIACDLDFALRFWPVHAAAKLPTLIGGALETSEAKFNTRHMVSQELLLKHREKAGLVREKPEIITRINEKILELQSYCRNEHAVPAEKVPELSSMLPYRGLMDINLNEQLGFLLLNMNDDEIANQMAWTGQYRRLATSLWTALAIRNPGIVLDCGAYDGLFGLIAGICSPQSYVICIEPEREAFARILLTLQANNLSNMSVVQYALDAAAGVASLFRLEQRQGLCRNNTIRPKRPCPLQDSQLVHTITADELLLIVQQMAQNEDARITLIKLNVCGNEAEVLQGMAAILQHMAPSILLTLHPATDSETAGQLLSAHGYSFYFLDEAALSINPIGKIPANISEETTVLATTLNEEQLRQQLTLEQN